MTKQQNAISALKESERKYRNLIESSRDAIWISSLDGDIIDCNNSALELFGHTRAEIKKIKIIEFIVNPKELVNFNEEISKKGYLTDYGIKLKKKDGTEMDCILSVSYKQENGKIVGYQGIVRDITERKRSKELIKHLNSIHSSIRKVNYIFANEKNMQRMLERGCQVLIGSQVYNNAWIALFDKNAILKSIAGAGLGDSFAIMTDNLRRGIFTKCGKKAIKHEGVVTINYPLIACGDCPLAKEYHEEGVMITRLNLADDEFGLFSVSTKREYIGVKEEIELFKAASKDIEFALHNIRNKN